MIFVAAMCFVTPQVDEASELLRKIRQSYHSVRAAEFYVHFEITDPSGKIGKGDAHFEFLAPNMLRAAIKGIPTGPAVVISDGKKIATFSADGRHKEIRFAAESLSHSLPSNVETFAFYDPRELGTGHGEGMEGSKLTIEKVVEWDGKHWTVLHETNIAEDLKVDYYVDPASLFIWRTYGVDTKTRLPFIDSRITSLTLKSTINPGRFSIALHKPKSKL